MLKDGIKNLIKYFLIKLIFIVTLLIKLLLIILLQFSKNSKKLKSNICIEAGVKGWESIEFKEYYQSAIEYLSEDQVYKFVLKNEKNYVKEVKKIIIKHKITHYLYDPRTGSQNTFNALFESILISIILNQYGVTPIALSTDLSVRRWRYQVAIVTALKGVVVCFMSTNKIKRMFPHNRVIGPSLMPFSVKTKNELQKIITNKKKNKVPRIIFSGSMYEPRTSILIEIRDGLKKLGIDFEILGRKLGSQRVSDSEYWERLVSADIVLTTADQMIQEGTDCTEIKHLIYRYLEVLVCGSILIAQEVPGVRRFFVPGEHFVTFDSSENAISQIHDIFQRIESFKEIAYEGNKRANVLIESRVFWVLIDSSLGKDSLYY